MSHIELESSLPGRESGQIIVLGMHRSGTSCLTGSLALAGAYVGDESAQMQAGAQNPKGFFERRDLRNYCDTLLMEAGADWWKLSSFSPDQINPATKWKAESFANPAFAEMAEHRPWIAKEPRFCVLLPALRDLLPDPVCIHIVRNPLEVARSLRERNGIPIQQGISLWEFYNQSAIRGSKGLRVVRVGYEQLLQDPALIVGQLLAKLRAFGVAGLTEPGGEEIRDFVDVSLHRQVADSGGEDAYLTKSQRQLWRLLQSDRELKSKDLPALPESTLVALQDLEFAKLNADRIPQLEKALKDQRVSERETSRALMKANDQLQALQNKLSATQEKLGATQEKLGATQEKLGATQEKLVSVTHDLRDARRDAEATRNKLASTRRELERSVLSRRELHAQFQAAQKQSGVERQDLKSRLQSVQKELAATRSQLDATRQSTSWRLTRPLRSFVESCRLLKWFLPRLVRGPGKTVRLFKDYRLIAASDLFDAEYYRSRNPDVGELTIDPALHFLLHGGREARNPSSQFSVPDYLQQNPDITLSRQNPLVHYLAFGRDEGRLAYPVAVARRTTPVAEARNADRLSAPSLVPVTSVEESPRSIDRDSFSVDVVVPVHNALQDVEACLKSVLVNTTGPYHLYLINDGSDAETSEVLRRFAGRRQEQCTLVEHSEAQGYTKAANAGLRRSSGDYVVLLNSDTIVPTGWIERLLECGESNAEIGVIGPLSNAASYQSVPELRDGADWKVNQLPAGVSVDDMATLVGHCSQRTFPRVSFINGFCYVIKRAVIESIGLLDEAHFPRGYGEENDYSLRARDSGFQLVIADNLYVYHAKSKSYTHETRRELAKVGRKALDEKHGAERVLADISANELQSAPLDSLRLMLRMLESEQLNHPPLSVLFLLIGEGGSGGAHSVVQEAVGLSRLGVRVVVAAHARTRERNLSIYSSVDSDLFYFYDYDVDLIRYAGRFQIVIATHFSTVEILERICIAAPQIMPAYYVQDYEPWIVPDSLPELRLQAEASYSRLPDVLLFAKTDWIRETVHEHHQVAVEKVIPSLDTQVYNLDRASRQESGAVHVVAMVRASTSRRAPHDTMRLLERLAVECGDQVRISIFGTDPKRNFFKEIRADFDFENHGVLVREDVADCLGSADIFIDMSVYQAFGRTGLEAMAVGCVPILPIEGGVSEYAIDGENSKVVDTSNLDDVLAAAVSLIRDESARKKLSMNALKTAARFSTGPAALSELLLFQRSYMARMVTIVIPVFNALDEVGACIDSVLAQTDGPYELVLIDDCSTDPDIWPLLQGHSSDHLFVRAMQNKENLGYTRTVNIGCAEARSDVVLLNSDTVVTQGWLRKLRDTARSQPRVATVTPLSNAAGAFSVPVNNTVNDLPSGISVELMGSLVEEVSGKLRPEVPTGNGFCLYITRGAIDEIGLFDEASFPRGYGEENDFCMRALKAGYKNLIEDSTFVFHHRSASFGDEKTRLAAAGSDALRSLHPEYKALVQDWLTDDPIDPMRDRLQQCLSLYSSPVNQVGGDGRQTLLYFLHNGSGGTLFTTLDLLKYSSRFYDCYLLQTEIDSWNFSRVVDGSPDEPEVIRFVRPWRINEEPDDERLSAFQHILETCRPDIVHMRHFIGNHPAFLSKLKHDYGLPVVMSLHDHYTVCPTIQLFDNNRSYCAGFCTPSGGDCSVGRRWFQAIPPLKHAYVHDWRETVGPALASADALVVTSGTTRDLIRRHYPYLRSSQFHLIPHGRDMQDYTDAFSPPENGRIRVVFFGALGPGKGTHFVHEMLKHNNERGRPIELHVLGDAKLPFDAEEFGVRFHGRYDRDSLPVLLGDIRPSVALLPSIGPETYCHVLTEAWASGLPVLGSSLGAVGERLRPGGGWILPATNPLQWLDKLTELATDSQELERQRAIINGFDLPSVADMAETYLRLYQLIANKHGKGKLFPAAEFADVAVSN